MSLINDALNRARAEAARREATGQGERLAPIVAPPPQRAPWRAAVLPLALVALAIAVAAGLALRRSAPVATPDLRPERSGGLPAEPIAAPTVGAVSASESSDGLAVRPAAPLTAPVSAPRQAPAPPNDAGTAVPPEPAPAPTEVEPSTAEPATVATSPIGTTPPPAVALGDEETWYYVGEVQLAEGTLELTGIAWSSTAPLAMLNGALLRVGDQILGFEVTAITPHTVSLEGRGQRIALQLGASQE